MAGLTKDTNDHTKKRNGIVMTGRRGKTGKEAKGHERAGRNELKLKSRKERKLKEAKERKGRKGNEEKERTVNERCWMT